MYFSTFYPWICLQLNWFSEKNHLFLAQGFYMKNDQNKIIFLISYKSSSFDDKNFLAYGVSRNYITSPKMTSSSLQKVWNPFSIWFLWYREGLCQCWSFGHNLNNSWSQQPYYQSNLLPKLTLTTMWVGCTGGNFTSLLVFP